MIAALIVVFGAAMWAMFVLADVVPRLKGTSPLPWQVAVDAGICTVLWEETVRIAGSAGLHNWRNVRPRVPRR